MPSTADLTDRQRDILSIVVQAYIDRGEPVSSLWLTRQRGLRLSSATVRNVLAKLEQMGFLHQPHTSAGRVPTDIGYRSYVDTLLEDRRPRRAGRTMEARLSQQADSVDELLSNVSHELARASRCLGFAIARPSAETAFEHIEFVPIGGSRVLAVVVSTGGQVTQKALEIPGAIDLDGLKRASRYLNTEFSGLPLTEVRAAIRRQLRHERVLYDKLLARTLRLVDSTFVAIAEQNALAVQGASSLLENAEHLEDLVPRTALRAVLELIEEKSRLIRLLDEYIEGPGLLVVIGTEHSSPDLQPFSLVATTYSEGHRAGTVGILGPTRMRYSRAIATVDGVAGALNRVLLRAGHDLGA